MTTPEAVLRECEARGIVLSVGERSNDLAFDAPRDAMTPDLRALVADFKPDLVQLLFEREERAALMGAPDWMDAATFLTAAEHSAVREVLRIFGGEIVSVRPLATCGELCEVE